MLELADENENGIHVCFLQGRLDATTSPGADEHLSHLFGETVSALLLDLSKLSYLSSKGLNVLLNTANRAKTEGCKFALISAQEAVKVILDISGVSSIVATYPTRAQAVAALTA